VVIVGVVTSKAGLLDSGGRRVTVQDDSGAILVRYPAETKPAKVGSVIRALGEVGTWFGARQLETQATPRRKRGGKVRAADLRRPPTAADEWRLVRVAVRITDVERSGDTWRAEAVLADGATLPIVGLAGSGIDRDLLEDGRAARITGLVKRAHPSASDQRFAIAPRSRKDIDLGRLHRQGDDDGTDERDDDERASGAASADDDGVSAATLSSLDGLEGRIVRVGGRVEAVRQRRLTLDDGTAAGTVRLAERAGPLDPSLELGDVVNAVGRVQRRRDQTMEVVVGSAADLRRAASTRVEALSADRPVAARLPLAVASSLESAGPADGTTASPPTSRVWYLFLLGAIALVACGSLVAASLLAWHQHRQPPEAPDAG
jgi:hypothetical protein